MEKQYWLHRVSHEWEVSYPLLSMGYLSIGWSRFAQTDVLVRIRREGIAGFHAFMAQQQETSRSRWNLWNFASFQRGDTIVVPLYDKEFAVFRVVKEAFAVSELAGQSFLSKKEETVEITGAGLQNTVTGKRYDIGFLVQVEPLRDGTIKRSYADSNLISRMKLRQANANITGIAESVEAALRAQTPISVHDVLIESVTENVQEGIRKYITPDNLERLVRWYMEKMGASRAWIPAKNERGKENGADADIIAEFDDLRIIFYIQVKKHTGETGSWSVNQISEYKRQKQDEDDDYTYIPWVISTADFSAAAKLEAKNAGVRLIGGTEFIKMLINCGIHGLDAAF